MQPARLDQGRQGRPAAVEHATGVYVHHPSPVGHRRVENGTGGDHSGVVDHHRQRPESVDDRLDRRRDLVVLGDVGDERQAALGRKRLRDRLELIHRPVDDCDARSLACELSRRLRADAGCRAGDGDNVVSESSDHRIVRRSGSPRRAGTP